MIISQGARSALAEDRGAAIGFGGGEHGRLSGRASDPERLEGGLCGRSVA